MNTQSAYATGYGLQDRAGPEVSGTQMDSVTTRLGTCVAEVGMEVDALIARLAVVLNPATKGEVGNRPVPVPVRSPLGSQIDAQSDALCVLRDRLRDALERLAV